MVHKSTYRPQKLFHSRNSVSTETRDSTHDQNGLSWSMFVISRYPMYCISLIRHCGYYFLYYCCSFMCGYYLRVATIWRQCLFLWKARRHVQQWLNKKHTCNTARSTAMEPPVLLGRHVTSTLRWLLDAGTSTHSLLILLSAIEMSRKTHKRPLALTQWLLSANICTQVHVPCILAVDTTKGWHLFCPELPILWLLYPRPVTIQGWCLIEDIRYTKLAVCGPNMWQSWVEIEYYSVAQFDCITAFEAL